MSYPSRQLSNGCQTLRPNQLLLRILKLSSSFLHFLVQLTVKRLKLVALPVDCGPASPNDSYQGPV